MSTPDEIHNKIQEQLSLISSVPTIKYVDEKNGQDLFVRAISANTLKHPLDVMHRNVTYILAIDTMIPGGISSQTFIGVITQTIRNTYMHNMVLKDTYIDHKGRIMEIWVGADLADYVIVKPMSPKAIVLSANDEQSEREDTRDKRYL